MQTITSSLSRSSFFFQAEDGIRDFHVTGVQTCALPIFNPYGYLDVGPTADGTPNGRPLPDHQVDFEDLLVFAGSYGVVAGPPASAIQLAARSEERRVGKECRSRWARYQ